MSRYIFDDSKDHDYDDELDQPRPIYQPAISPGKVTLTSRIVRVAPLATNNHQSAQTVQPSATSVQRKAEMTPSVAPIIDSKMSAWDLAIRPDSTRLSRPIPPRFSASSTASPKKKKPRCHNPAAADQGYPPRL